MFGRGFPGNETSNVCCDCGERVDDLVMFPFLKKEYCIFCSVKNIAMAKNNILKISRLWD